MMLDGPEPPPTTLGGPAPGGSPTIPIKPQGVSIDDQRKFCESCRSLMRRGPRGIGSGSRCFQKTLETLLEAADSGCVLCQSIAYEIRTHRFEKGELFPSPRTSLNIDEAMNNEYTNYTFHAATHLNKPCYDLNIYLTRRSAPILQLRLVPLHETEPGILTGLSYNDSTGSDTCWKQVLQWYNHCFEKHENCGGSQARSLWYPTRVLDVGNEKDQIVKLKITGESDMQGPYLTLSHRWGDNTVYKLTEPKLENFKTGIHVADLPRTFTQAIEVTRRLQIRYLWIDSLCIIQDSVHDWQIESVQMETVYANAHLNIAATAANNSQEGLFRPRNKGKFWPTEVVIMVKGASRQYLAYDPDVANSQLEAMPLNRRAWVLQERFLSPRVLHFAETQLFWECHGGESCEMFPRSIPPGEWPKTNHKSLDPRAFLERAKRLRWPMNKVLSNSIYPYQIWADTVSRYTQCGITKSEDKLVAISGIAKYISHLIDDEYLAGIWRSTIPKALLWYISTYHPAKEVPPFRPTPYRAPSWSWASVEGQIHNTSWLYSSYIDIDPYSTSCVQIHEAMITPLVEGDVYGQVTSGFLRLSGTLLSGFGIVLVPNNTYNNYRVACSEKEKAELDSDIVVGLDVPPTSAELDMTCLLVALADEYEHCLLLRLRSDKGLNVYERVGTVTFARKARVFQERESVADFRERLGWCIARVEIILV